MDSGIWSGNMKLERKEGIRKSAGKVLKMSAWGRGKDTWVFSKGRNAEGNVEKQSGRRSWSFEERLDMRKGSELTRVHRKEIREGKRRIEMGDAEETIF